MFRVQLYYIILCILTVLFLTFSLGLPISVTHATWMPSYSLFSVWSHLLKTCSAISWSNPSILTHSTGEPRHIIAVLRVYSVDVVTPKAHFVNSNEKSVGHLVPSKWSYICTCTVTRQQVFDMTNVTGLLKILVVKWTFTICMYSGSRR